MTRAANWEVFVKVTADGGCGMYDGMYVRGVRSGQRQRQATQPTAAMALRPVSCQLIQGSMLYQHRKTP